MELPSHPDADDSAAGQEPASKANWGTRIVVGAIVALLLLVVILHLTGVVGPARH